MKLRAPAIAAGLLVLGTLSATAQSVVIAPEQQVVIREYVKKQPLASITLPGVELNVGTPIPDTVELYAIDVPDVQYRYVVIDGRTVLVDPGTRQVIQVID